MSPWWAGGAGLLFLLFTGLVARDLSATLRPTNWLLRVRGYEVLIKYRSYQNWRLGDADPQVLVLDRGEIEFVRQAAQTQVTQVFRGEQSGGRQLDKQVYLEIGLKAPDTSDLEKALADEQARPGWGNARSRTKYLDNPVQVVEKGVIRIPWSSGTAGVRPGIASALDTLARIVEVGEARKGVEDFTVAALKKLGKEEQKQRLRELAGQNKIKAVETAKLLYSCSLSEAMQIVE